MPRTYDAAYAPFNSAVEKESFTNDILKTAKDLVAISPAAIDTQFRALPSSNIQVRQRLFSQLPFLVGGEGILGINLEKAA